MTGRRLYLLFVFGVACTGDTNAPSSALPAPTGRLEQHADFFSVDAKEYVLNGRSFVTVEDGKGLKRAKNLIPLKQVGISWFINQTLMEDEDEATHEIFGFGALVKAGDEIATDIKQINANSFEFQFQHIVAGKLDLPKLLDVEFGEEFFIEIGKPTNEELKELTINEEWYRQEPFDPWDPDKVPQAQKEELFLTLSAEEPSADAWWDYPRLFEDGLIRIDVHFGWDFHENFHLKHSKSLYNWLTKEKGFSAPVKNFDNYSRKSKPLVRHIDVNGKDVKIEIRIYRGVPGTETDTDTTQGGKLLEKDLRASLNVADVIIFNGHSGPFFGFPMANWHIHDQGDFDDSEMREADMPADKYQIVYGEGCDTFHIGPAFLQNVNKQGENIDIVTTTSLADAESMPIKNFLSRLLDLDSQARHRPLTVRAFLSELDVAAMYGVHGIDDNPQLHPYAAPENFCAPCETNTECGGAGNLCIPMPKDGLRCSAPCTTDAACGEGFVCKKAPKHSTSLFKKVCRPKASSCDAL
jgi:hypothetical protein